MVRLKEWVGNFEFTASIMFQFQYGAIKGTAHALSTSLCLRFQFQYGAIKGTE